MRRYGSEDGDRWAGFAHRDDDIVISTRSKCGTTWVQMVCALLVFQETELPAPLAEISPWIDWSLRPVDEVFAQLDAQEHRRIIKTHTPLDGFPLDDRVTYVVVARRPIDAAVSFFHHVRNIDRAKVAGILGHPARTPPDVTVEAWLHEWVRDDVPLTDELDVLSGHVHHVLDARARAAAGLDVVLLHYADLEADLDGSMRALADRLGIEVPPERWPALVAAARFDSMAARAEDLVPDGLGIFHDPAAFFRTGRSGAGARFLSSEDRARYRARLAELAPPEVVAWLDR